MRSRLLAVAVVSLALVALMGGVAWGQETYTSPDECYTCHGVTGVGAVGKVDFAVPAVNYAKCAGCHAAISTAQHWHNPNSTYSTCTGCHRTVVPIITNATLRFTSRFVSPDFGRFKASTSLSSSPQTLHAAHAGSGWVNSLVLKAGSTANCANCHRAVTCSACHGDSVAHTDHAAAEYPGVSYLQSTGTGTTTAPSTCVNSSCHDPAKAATAEFVPWCGSCHPARVQEHGYDTIDHVADDGATEGIACSTCHSLDLATTHGDPGAAGASCATCHPMPRKSFDAWDQSCATGGCHTATSTAPMHADTATAHQVDAGNQLCLDCHTGTELGSIHAGAEKTTGETSCLVCHTARSVPATRDCTTCHFTFDEHYDETAHSSAALGCSGTGCHATPDLMTVHNERNAAFGCFGCHSSIRTAVQDAITAGDTSCSACHGTISALGGHRDAHWMTPPLADDDGTPNYSYHTGSAGAAPTRDCAGCHTSNLVDEHLGLNLGGWVRFPRYDSTGVAFTCGTCHDQPEGSTVQDAIGAGLSACESCHVVHGPIPAVHASTFVDVQDVPCADCHSANLDVEHIRYTNVKSTAGLSGCDVCHELYTGMTSGSVTGEATQAAISTGNDTRCSACHTAYHTDATAHQATTDASKACAACHTEGGTDVIDIAAIHADAELGACKVCHTNAARVPDIFASSAECSSCHAAEGEDYHRNMAVHVAPESGCSVTGCHHASPDVTVIHADGCATCHDGSALPATTACDNCHVTVVEDYHYDFNVDHTPTDAYSAGCAECHDTTDVRALHVTNGCNQCHFIDGCADCHTAHAGGADLVKSTSCSTCHDVEGTDGNYHTAIDASHRFSAMNATCLGCHPNTLPEAHAEFLSRYPAYDSTCDLCHKNADPSRIDWATASADCSSCHEIHGDIAAVHTATSSQACVDCHESADVRTLHAATPDASCDVCHNAPAGRIDWTTATVECTSCHGTLAPVDPKHYPAAAHLATTESGCTLCHSADMKNEHFKSTVAVSCVACHEVKVDAFTAPWNKTCTACHPTKHANQAAAHKSTNTTCTGTGCHVVTDVSVLHGTNCAACHAAGVKASTNCTQCHPGTNPHHATITLKMTSDSTWKTVCGSCHGRTHSMGSCSRCHAPSRLHNESGHVDQNSRCAGCHKVATADTAKNCLACHASVQSGSGGGSWGGWGR